MRTERWTARHTEDIQTDGRHETAKIPISQIFELKLLPYFSSFVIIFILRVSLI